MTQTTTAPPPASADDKEPVANPAQAIDWPLAMLAELTHRCPFQCP